MHFYRAALTLLLVMDPLGNVPIFASMLRKHSYRKQTRIISRETAIAFGVLILMLFFGRLFLDTLHITMTALQITGALILLMIAIRMVFPSNQNDPHLLHKEPFIVPIAIPLTSGPAAIATVILFSSEPTMSITGALIAIVLAFVVYLPVVLASQYLLTWLGERLLEAVERLMGMLLILLAIQMFLTGFASFWASLPH